MKKIITFTLALAIVFSVFTAVPAFAKTYKDFTYKVKNGTVTILRYKGKAADVKVPSKIGGKKVVKIAGNAFIPDSGSENLSLKTVVIPDTVTSIGSSAFSMCTKLSKVTLGKNVKVISPTAFYSCSSLKTIKLPDKLEKLCGSCFALSGLGTIAIPKNVKFIGRNALSSDKLTKITVDPKNKAFSAASGLLYNKKKTRLVWCPRKIGAKTVSVAGSVTVIGQDAMFGVTTATSVKLPKKLTKICENGICLYRCKSITIPETVNDFGMNSVVGMEKGFTIRGKKGSLAEKYAQMCGYKFIAV